MITTMMTYIAGPMTGLPDQNYPAFREVTKLLRESGHRVISPHETISFEDRDPDHQEWTIFLRKDLLTILTLCDSLVLLPGWEMSKGATLELLVAKTLGFQIYEWVGPNGVGIVPWRGADDFLAETRLAAFVAYDIRGHSDLAR